MKAFFLLPLLVLFAACDPYGFGFKKNPAFVLDEAFQSVTNLDTESFVEVTGKEALCVYGNDAGLHYLKDNVVLSPENVKLNPTVLKTSHFTSPKYVGYWSYYHERYQIDINDKVTNELILKAYVDCDYGTDGEKNDNLINLKPKKYRKKECRVVKVLPLKFAALPVPAKCESFKVDL
jgi:hypothetical protein